MEQGCSRVSGPPERSEDVKKKLQLEVKKCCSHAVPDQCLPKLSNKDVISTGLHAILLEGLRESHVRQEQCRHEPKSVVLRTLGGSTSYECSTPNKQMVLMFTLSNSKTHTKKS